MYNSNVKPLVYEYKLNKLGVLIVIFSCELNNQRHLGRLLLQNP